MALLCEVTVGPKGVRDVMLRNLKLAERAVKNMPSSVDAATAVAAITELVQANFDVPKKKSKKAE